MAIQEVLAHQLEMDELVLKHLAERGDVASQIHAVEHHFFSDDRDALVPLCEYAALLRLAAEEIHEGEREEDGAPYWYVDIVSRIPLIDGHIFREAALMKLLAIAYRVTYDGWGTHVHRGAA